jgi:hypothetical protein
MKESCANERELPLSIGKNPVEYLQTLKENLELDKVYADYYSDFEQKRHADHYNLRSTDRGYHLDLGDKLIALAPDLVGAKLYFRWQGPGTTVEVKSPFSYTIEIDGNRRHIHANKIRKFNERIEQAMITSCSVIFDKDGEFGSVSVLESMTSSEHKLSLKTDPEKLDHLTDIQRQKLFAVLKKISRSISEKPGYCPLFEHESKVT